MQLLLKHGIATVDDADLDLVSGIDWKSLKVGQRYYAYGIINSRTVYMHRLVLGLTPRGRGGGDVDHINGNGLDNRRCNLRLATRSQNGANARARAGTSRFKGVSWNWPLGRWQAHIMVNYQSRYLGSYEVEEDAARAYDIAARGAFGDHARLNLPDRIDEAAPQRSTSRNKPRQLPATRVSNDGMRSRQGAGNPNAKLTEDDARRLIAKLQSVPRRTYPDLAVEFGISVPMVANIARGKAWRHLQRA